MDTIPRRLARLVFETVCLVLMLPFIAVIFVAVAIGSAFSKFELWAYYGGDEKARDKEEWKYR